MAGYIPFAVSCKFWEQKTLTVDEVRPGRCPGCGVGSRTEKGKLNLHGHGRRERIYSESQESGRSEALSVLHMRRYRCRQCKAVVSVGPWDLLPRGLYTVITICLALALWGNGESLGTIRLTMGAWSLVGFAAQGRWETLRRWARRACQGKIFNQVQVPLGGPLRARTHRFMQVVASTGPPSSPWYERMVRGCQHFR